MPVTKFLIVYLLVDRRCTYNILLLIADLKNHNMILGLQGEA
jgi:hypothetical protein